MKKIIYIFTSLTSCKKDDVSKNVTITGNVRNNCTGTGFSDATMQLIATFEKSFGKKETSITETSANSNGDFSFIADVHQSDKYSYLIKTPSYSNSSYEFFGVTGELDKGNISGPYQM